MSSFVKKKKPLKTKVNQLLRRASIISSSPEGKFTDAHLHQESKVSYGKRRCEDSLMTAFVPCRTAALMNLMKCFFTSRGQLWMTALVTRRRKRREGKPTMTRPTAMDLYAFILLNESFMSKASDFKWRAANILISRYPPPEEEKEDENQVRATQRIRHNRTKGSASKLYICISAKNMFVHTWAGDACWHLVSADWGAEGGTRTHASQRLKGTLCCVLCFFRLCVCGMKVV